MNRDFSKHGPVVMGHQHLWDATLPNSLELRDTFREGPRDEVRVVKSSIRWRVQFQEWVASRAESATKRNPRLYKKTEIMPTSSKKISLQLRVRKPVQKPRTTPKTIENCSNAMSDPRTSGGLISAMYRGANILATRRVNRNDESWCMMPHLRAPTPTPPIARPMNKWLSCWAKHWNVEPIQKMTDLGKEKRIRNEGISHLCYLLHATRMEDCLVYLSVYIPAIIAPVNAPNSKIAAFWKSFS